MPDLNFELNSAELGWGEFEILESPDQLKSSATFDGHQYWLSKCGSETLPLLTHIDLMEIYHIAPKINIRDVVDGGVDFRHRFWGTELSKWYGLDATGKTLQDYYPPDLIETGRLFFRGVMKARAPVYAIADVAIGSKSYLTIEGVYMPLLGTSDEVEHIMSIEEIVP